MRLHKARIVLIRVFLYKGKNMYKIVFFCLCMIACIAQEKDAMAIYVSLEKPQAEGYLNIKGKNFTIAGVRQNDELCQPWISEIGRAHV